MKNHKGVNMLVADAESERRCLFGAGDAICRALRRRVSAGELTSPYAQLYARSSYWNTLNPMERILYVLRALALQHPQWVFAGISAATVLGLDHPWALHDDGCVWIATDHTVGGHTNPRLRKIFMPRIRAYECQGIRIVSPARVLVDCALRYPFRMCLPLFDAAWRRSLTNREQVCAAMSLIRADKELVNRLLRFVDGLSENGGESLCRATLIEAGFSLPQLQRVFVDPTDSRRTYRADFTWVIRGGRVVVLEFDGNEKYVNPQMTGSHSTEQVVYEERMRESALKRAGVTMIVRTNYREVLERYGLIAKLCVAGIPPSGAQ